MLGRGSPLGPGRDTCNTSSDVAPDSHHPFGFFFPAEQSGSSDIVTLCQIADVYQACDPNTEKKKPHESEVICTQTPLFSPPAY